MILDTPTGDTLEIEPVTGPDGKPALAVRIVNPGSFGEPAFTATVRGLPSGGILAGFGS